MNRKRIYGLYVQWNIIQTQKRENLEICDYTGEFGEYYAKWNKSDREWKILKNIVWYYLYMDSRKAKLIVTEWWFKESGAGG